MVEAAARGEYNPNQMQGYMAKVWLDRHPAAAALPATMLADGEDCGDKLIEMVGRLHRARTERLDEKLRGWLASGRVDEDFAAEIRALYADDGDEPFDPIGRGVRITEIIEPSQAPVVVRKRNPPQIDGSGDGYRAEEPMKAAETLDISGGRGIRNRGKTARRCTLFTRRRTGNFGATGCGPRTSMVS
jgi:hypothetical protein